MPPALVSCCTYPPHKLYGLVATIVLPKLQVIPLVFTCIAVTELIFSGSSKIAGLHTMSTAILPLSNWLTATAIPSNVIERAVSSVSLRGSYRVNDTDER
jgi:hypothetical protein